MGDPCFKPLLFIPDLWKKYTESEKNEIIELLCNCAGHTGIAGGQDLDLRYENRVKFPPGMKSGYYKYIVFDPVEKSTGKVYADLCHEIMNYDMFLPNAKWVSENHWCIPLYYNPDF